MKTSKISILGMLLAIIFISQSAMAFYNPQTGRWLSRDPIEERGGKSIYVFVKNDSIRKIDVLGMSDYQWTGTTEEKGNGPDKGGFAEPSYKPEAMAFSVDGCCYGVELSGGTASAHIVYTDGTVNGYNILEHERYHVSNHLIPAYEDFKTAAKALGQPCMSKVRAMCIKAVIGGQLNAEYDAHARMDGTQYDWDLYGNSSPDPEIQEDSWNRVAKWAQLYEEAQAATSLAIAACPAD